MLAYIFPNFTESLISISQIINMGLTVTYCGNFVTMIKDNVTMFQNAQDTNTRLRLSTFKILQSKKPVVPPTSLSNTTW